MIVRDFSFRPHLFDLESRHESHLSYSPEERTNSFRGRWVYEGRRPRKKDESSRIPKAAEFRSATSCAIRNDACMSFVLLAFMIIQRIRDTCARISDVCIIQYIICVYNNYNRYVIQSERKEKMMKKNAARQCAQCAIFA